MREDRRNRRPGKVLETPEFNVEAHAASHMPRILVYTSPSTISTDTSVPITPPRGGKIVAVHLNVKVAPTSTMEVDVLIGGTSIFDTKFAEITNGELSSGLNDAGDYDEDARHPGDPGAATFRAFEKIEIDVITVAAATGPLVVQLEIDWED